MFCVLIILLAVSKRVSKLRNFGDELKKVLAFDTDFVV